MNYISKSVIACLNRQRTIAAILSVFVRDDNYPHLKKFSINVRNGINL